MENEADVREVIALFRLNYDRAVARGVSCARRVARHERGSLSDRQLISD